MKKAGRRHFSRGTEINATSTGRTQRECGVILAMLLLDTNRLKLRDI